LGNPSHNAHRFETVTVYYRWHPLFGQSLPVRQRKRGTDGECFVCKLADSTTLSIPAWMLDPECAHLALGPPQIAVAALLELRDLLSALQLASGFHNTSLRSFREEAAADEATSRTILQLNLSFLNATATVIPGGKQKELTLALVELLSSAAAEGVQPQANGGDDESETHA
jgi:hypothetical protein